MVVKVVEVLNSQHEVIETTSNTVVVEVVRNTVSPIETTSGAAVVEVLGHNIVQNAVVSENPPLNPYEGQVWIDVS